MTIYHDTNSLKQSVFYEMQEFAGTKVSFLHHYCYYSNSDGDRNDILDKKHIDYIKNFAKQYGLISAIILGHQLQSQELQDWFISIIKKKFQNDSVEVVAKAIAALSLLLETSFTEEAKYEYDDVLKKYIRVDTEFETILSEIPSEKLSKALDYLKGNLPVLNYAEEDDGEV